MAYTCNITRRTNGGYTVIWDGASSYPSEISYHGTETGVILFAKGFHMTRFYRPSEWTIDATGSYTTVTEICDALDAMGVGEIDPLDDIESLVTIMSEWDESDRAKANIIVGHAGVDAGSGAQSSGTIRATLATDDPAVIALQLLDNAVDGNYLNVNLNVSGTDVATSSGNLTAQTLRVAVASDDVNVSKLVTALEIIDDWDDSNFANVNLNVSGSDVAGGTGASTAQTLRVIHASDDPAVTALQILDDWDDSDYCNVNLNVSGSDVAGGSGNITAQTLRMVLASDQPQLASDIKVTLDSEEVSIASGGLPWNRFSAAAVVSTGQAVSSGWSDFGSEIDVQGYKSLLVWTSLTHYDSSNCRVKALAKHATSGADEYELPIKTVSTSDVKVNALYYELDTDVTQNMALDFDVAAVPFVQLQIQAGTVGTTGDVIAASITKMY